MPPRTRGDCVDGPRPCPHLGCRHHIWTDVNLRPDLPSKKYDERGRMVRLRRGAPGRGRPELPDESCALDVADEGGHTLERVGEILGVTRERIRQIEKQFLEKLKKSRTLRLLNEPLRD